MTVWLPLWRNNRYTLHRIYDGWQKRPVNASVTAKQASKMLLLVRSRGLACFHGLYHQHVKQEGEGTSDAVNDDGDDITNLQRGIYRTSHLYRAGKLSPKKSDAYRLNSIPKVDLMNPPINALDLTRIFFFQRLLRTRLHWCACVSTWLFLAHDLQNFSIIYLIWLFILLTILSSKPNQDQDFNRRPLSCWNAFNWVSYFDSFKFKSISYEMIDRHLHAHVLSVNFFSQFNVVGIKKICVWVD